MGVRVRGSNKGGRGPGSRVDVSLLCFLSWVRLCTFLHFISAVCDVSEITGV